VRAGDSQYLVNVVSYQFFRILASVVKGDMRRENVSLDRAICLVGINYIAGNRNNFFMPAQTHDYMDLLT